MRKRSYWNTAAAQRLKQDAGLEDIDLAIGKIAERQMEGLNGPPTDLIELAARLGIKEIRLDDTMLVPGELRKLKNELFVYLLPNLTKTRRRFTLAHELGHAYFEKTGRRPNPSRELEQLCDKLAAEFLMPGRQFKLHSGRNPDLARVHELCEKFETGLEATLRRVSDIYRYRAIEMLDSEVVWSRRLGGNVLRQVSSELQKLCGQTGTAIIVLYENRGYLRWELEWRSLSSEDHKIGLLRPASFGFN